MVKAVATWMLDLLVDDLAALLSGLALVEEGIQGVVEADFFDWLGGWRNAPRVRSQAGPLDKAPWPRERAWNRRAGRWRTTHTVYLNRKS